MTSPESSPPTEHAHEEPEQISNPPATVQEEPEQEASSTDGTATLPTPSITVNVPRGPASSSPSLIPSPGQESGPNTPQKKKGKGKKNSTLKQVLLVAHEEPRLQAGAVKSSEAGTQLREQEARRLKKKNVKRSNSIADFKRGITPLQLAKQKEEKKRKKRQQNEGTGTLEEEGGSGPSSPHAAATPLSTLPAKSLKKFHTVISCNASLLALQAEKTAETRQEETRRSRRVAGALMQYSHVIRKEDDNSLLAQVLSQAGEFLDITGELQASWARNVERRVITPMRELSNTISAAQTDSATEDEALAGHDLAACVNSLIGLAGVYNNFFRVGGENLGNCYGALMEYRSIVAMDAHDRQIKFEVGRRCSVPFEHISLHGTMLKKGLIRHNWKQRWFVLYFHHLLYFTSQSESVLRGDILLENAVVTINGSRKHPHTLQIACQARTFLIAFESDASMQQWKTLIEASVIKQPLSAKRQTIALVEPKFFVTAGKSYKPPAKLEELLRQDLFSRHWRDFRAKDPGMMGWITQPSLLCDLITNALMFVPDVTKEEISVMEEAVKHAEEEKQQKQQKGFKRTLSTFVRSRQENAPSLSVEQLKRSNNALLYKYAHNAFTLLVSSEQMAEALVQCPTVLQHLFDFPLDEKPPVQPRRFHAFTEIVFHLLRHRSTEVFRFLSERPTILEAFFRHMENEHCLRFLLSLWSYTQSEEKVDVLNRVGVEALQRYFHTPDLADQERENLTILIRELIRRHRLLNMRPETALILNKMRETENLSSLPPLDNINLDEGLEAFTPRTRRRTSEEIEISPVPPSSEESSGESPAPSESKREALSCDNEPGTDKFSHAQDLLHQMGRPRRESEVRHDWEDIGWMAEDEDEDEDASGEEEPIVEEEVVSPRSAPQKPLPSLPAHLRTNQEAINARAPGYIEAKVAPFIFELKQQYCTHSLIQWATQSPPEDQPRWQSSVELIISILKINRSKESTSSAEGHNTNQQAPHHIIRQLASKSAIIAELIKAPPLVEGEPRPPLGLFRYHLVRIIRYLLDCGYYFVDRNMEESGLLVRTLDLAFAFPNHSMLLSTVADMIDIIYTRPMHTELCVYLLQEYHFASKLIQVVEAHRALPVQPAIISYVINFANTLSAHPATQRILREDERWVEFLADDIFPQLLQQHVSEVDIPEPDPERRRAESDKWKKRWEDFNFIFSI